MARLVVLRDPLRGVREHHRLMEGATVADELRRLYPQGFDGRWTLHKAEALPVNEIATDLHEQIAVEPDAVYIVTIRPAGPSVIPFVLQIAASIAVAIAIKVISSFFIKTKRGSEETLEEQQQSANNKLAGQTNQLRAGARVPEILGRVRSYPDLICNAVEEWEKRNQQLRQLFVIGMGSHDITDMRLGDTPIFAVAGASPFIIQPGEVVPQYPMLKACPEVGGISLLTEDETAIPTPGADFTASPKTMALPDSQPWANNIPIVISGSSFNNGLRWIVGVPSSGPPYVFTLEGPVANEVGANPIISLPVGGTPVTRVNCQFGFGEIFDDPSVVPYQVSMQALSSIAVGQIIEIKNTTATYRGKVSNFYTTTDAGHTLLFHVIRMTDLYGAQINFAAGGYYVETSQVTLWSDESGGGGGPAPPPPDFPAPTNWYRLPIKNPDEVWYDIGFPQGLVQYVSGVRYSLSVNGLIRIRRPGGVGFDIKASGWAHTESTSGGLRYTHRVVISTLGLPAGDEIEVQVQRLSMNYKDDATHQYVHECTLDRVAAMKWQAARVYPDVTIIMLTMANNRSSVQLGDTSFNCIATRRLPTWTGSAWSVPVGTEKWADSLIARMKASDGANKVDSEIDIAGIYEVQATLNAQDGGDQGKISYTLDQVQDIDTELQTIASIARCQVYRIGRKLFVTRDQSGKVPLALFTGRSKAAEGEQVQLAMKNDADNDAVIVSWFDRDNGWKQRQYQYPEDVIPFNPLQIAPAQATWAQTYRRAVYEWNRIQYRRDTLSMEATEEARLIHIGDVVNVTDDIANVAQTAGEVFGISGLILWLDREVNVAAGGFTIMLRGQDGRALDTIPITQGTTLRHVVLSRAPIFVVKGRDESLGSIYAVYQTASAVIRQWLVASLEPQATYTRVVGVNWRAEVFTGDTGSVPSPPLFAPVLFEVPDAD